jgi:hypothetical protein
LSASLGDSPVPARDAPQNVSFTGPVIRGGAVETVTQFVQRTQGPAVPFVPGWYPWVYAHHYLRLEAGQLPPELGQGRTSLTAGEALEVIQLWCALSGEGIEPAAEQLADAYLRRWGLIRPTAPSAPAAPEATPATRRASVRRRTGRVRQARRRVVRRERARTVASPVPAGRRASAGS